MKPQPQPVQENPRPKPKRFCSQSKITFRNVSLSSPERQPGRWFMISSFGNISAIKRVSTRYSVSLRNSVYDLSSFSAYTYESWIAKLQTVIEKPSFYKKLGFLDLPGAKNQPFALVNANGDQNQGNSGNRGNRG